MVGGMKFIRSRALLKKRTRRKSVDEEPLPATSSSAAETADSRIPAIAVKLDPKPSRECASPDSVAYFPSQNGYSEETERENAVHQIPGLQPSIDVKEPAADLSREQLSLPDTPIITFSACPLKSTLGNHGGRTEEKPSHTVRQPKVIGKKRVSFADEDGAPLQEVRMIEVDPTRRLLLLLLSPQDRKFEFLNLEYPLDDNTTVKVLVAQIPKLASNPLFRRFTFSCLARTSRNEQLDSDMLMGDCDLNENELLLGVPMGYKVAQIGAFAVPLLLNGDIIKAVKMARKSGKGLKAIQSGNEWKRRGKSRIIPKSSTKVKVSITGDEQPQPPALVDSLEPTVTRVDADFIPTMVSAPSRSTASTGDSTFNSSIPNVGTPTTTTARSFLKADPLKASFSDCKAELSRLAALEPRPIPTVKSISRPGSYEDLESLETNARSVVDQLVRRASQDNDDKEDDGSSGSIHDDLFVDSGDSFEEPPDMMEDNDDQPKDTQVPDLVQNILGGGTDKVVLLLHAMSIAAVGYFATLMN